MVISSPASRGHTKRRLLRRLAVLTTALALPIVALAGPASAEQQCRAGNGAVVCLSIDGLANSTYAVHIGIDVSMSRQDAQAIIDAPGDPVSARVLGADTFDDNLFSVPLTAVWASAESGLSAEFDIIVNPFQLDEDDAPGDRGDEVFGRVRFVDPRTNTSRTFNTPEIHRDF
ncbi:hypothetical protein [Nonomuraea sp. NPDC003804]|uniref:hypothetical protein n=1 Tax=Nonomuraea sp. NPDC003804 TaxID=3154547 RepID=UPI00339DE9FD